jgi:hypothetical protein
LPTDIQHLWHGGRSKSPFRTLFQTYMITLQNQIQKKISTEYQKYRTFPYQVFKKLQSKRMNSDNLQAVTHAMGIDHTKVKAKVTWYLFSYAHKTTISMKRYTRSYDLSIKPMRLSLIPIYLNLINPLIALEHG